MQRALVAIALIVVLANAPAWAVASGTALVITMVDVRNDGTFLISLSSNLTGISCGTGAPNRLSANSNTVGGKALLQTALAAFLAGKRVNVQSTGACSEYTGIESLYMLQVQ
jgi:hypothetical protein